MRRSTIAGIALALVGTTGLVACSASAPDPGDQGSAPPPPASSATAADTPPPSSPASKPTGSSKLPAGFSPATVTVTHDGTAVDLSGIELGCAKIADTINVVTPDSTGDTSVVARFTDTRIETFLVNSPKFAILTADDLTVAKSGTTWTISGTATNMKVVPIKKVQVKATITCDAA